MTTKKTVGILGGMGPYATAMFFNTILELTPAKKDWEHLHIVIDNNPHIPSRSRHFLYGEASPVPGMIESCKRLQAYPVDFIAIPCNSACYFLEQVASQINVPVMNIIEITAKAVTALGKQNARCAVLGGRVTYASRSYERPLTAQGHAYIHHEETFQKELEDLIESIKINDGTDHLKRYYKNLVEGLQRAHDVDVIIAGCTELAYFNQGFGGLTLVDSSRELAKAVIRLASDGEESSGNEE